MNYYFMLRISSSSWSREPSSRPIHFPSHYVYKQFSRTLFAGINNRQSIKLDRADDESFHLEKSKKKSWCCCMNINIKMQGELFTWNVTKFISQFIHFYRRVLVRLFSLISFAVCRCRISTHTRIASHRIAQPYNTNNKTKWFMWCTLSHRKNIARSVMLSGTPEANDIVVFSLFYSVFYLFSPFFSSDTYVSFRAMKFDVLFYPSSLLHFFI